LIGIQYSLSKTFLIEKRLSKTEVEKKEKEYDGKREAFTRRVDATLKMLENETADFETIKTQYYALKDQIGDEIDAVKDEVEQLRHYEELKKSIDQDILKQKVDYQKTLDDVHGRITLEEKRYQKIMDDLASENARIKAERGEFADIKREEDDLTKRIDALQDILKSVTSRLDTQNKTVALHEDRLFRLRELAEKLQKELAEKKEKEIEPLLKISKDQEARILRIQDEIVAKVKGRRDVMQSAQDQSDAISKRFAGFFDKRMKTEALLKDLEKAKQEMKDELNDLIKKAKAYDLAAKGADTQAHIKELEGKFAEFDKKKNAFGSSLEKLKNVIMGTDKDVAKFEEKTAKAATPAKSKTPSKAAKAAPKKAAAKKKR
jgi:chromosome segregation ATPase